MWYLLVVHDGGVNDLSWTAMWNSKQHRINCEFDWWGAKIMAEIRIYWWCSHNFKNCIFSNLISHGFKQTELSNKKMTSTMNLPRERIIYRPKAADVARSNFQVTHDHTPHHRRLAPMVGSPTTTVMSEAPTFLESFVLNDEVTDFLLSEHTSPRRQRLGTQEERSCRLD